MTHSPEYFKSPTLFIYSERAGTVAGNGYVAVVSLPIDSLSPWTSFPSSHPLHWMSHQLMKLRMLGIKEWKLVL